MIIFGLSSLLFDVDAGTAVVVVTFGTVITGINAVVVRGAAVFDAGLLVAVVVVILVPSSTSPLSPSSGSGELHHSIVIANAVIRRAYEFAIEVS